MTRSSGRPSLAARRRASPKVASPTPNVRLFTSFIAEPCPTPPKWRVSALTASRTPFALARTAPIAAREELQRAVGRGLDASGDGHVAEVRALLARALRGAARGRGRHRGEVEPDLPRGEAGDEAVRPVRHGLERRGVGEHRADDVRGGRGFSRAVRDATRPRSRGRVPGCRFQTVRGKPAWRIRRAMGAPIAPRPRKATRVMRAS